jgi:uncharacterized protein DUF5907
MARLPIPGQDSGTWGTILNEYLAQSHKSDGTLKDGSVTSTTLTDGSVKAAKFNTPSSPTTNQLLGYDGTNLAWMSPSGSPDATNSSKGVVQLAGDLTGTATAPSVAKIKGITLPASAPTTGQVLTATSGTTTGWSSPAVGAQALTATSVKTSNYTASAGDLIPADASGGNFTITLPTAPTDKSRITIKKIDTTTNAVTIALAGSDVLNKSGGGTSVNLVLLNQAISLQYASSSSIWYVVADDLPLSQLDVRHGPIVGSDAWLKLHAGGNLDALITGVITRDSNGAATSAGVVWPDGVTGTYTATTVSTTFPGAVDAYAVTYSGTTTKTVSQPAVTRGSSGAVTNRPAMVVS